MKFENIKIKNFRQYYGNINIDLTTSPEKNIVIIGGKNGYGKTNLLLSIVWCLYGEKISQIDDNFKKEIQKEKNYSSFMQQSINWTAKSEGVDHFSVSLTIEGIELPQREQLQNNLGTVTLSRTRNINTTDEFLSIVDSNSGNELFTDEVDKLNFINDYLIPVDAAKFVFFDAEKISEIANLSIKDEGSFINDALGKILGLDIYDTLIEDLEYYINSLKKEGATKNLQEEIIDKEKAIELYNVEIEKLEEDNAEKLKEIDDYKKQIRQFDNLISQSNKQVTKGEDRNKILLELDSLELKETSLTEKFNELSELIPLVILTGKLEELNSQIELQENNLLSRSILNENSEKIENFIELLFNRPPEPENSTMSFKDKSFYYQKAKKLSNELFYSGNSYEELEFEHDLNNAETSLILDAVKLVNSQSNDVFKITIEEFNEIRIKRAELTKLINKSDLESEDELILDYSSKKETADYNITELNRKIGENTQQISKLKGDIFRLNQQLTILVKKVDINAQNKLKIHETNKYIDVLHKFLEEQKDAHKMSLEKTILTELKKMMHKLQSNDNESKFIEDIKVTILATGQGMKITLLDQDDNEIKKESLSSGEKQIYISCLIKAILSQSIQTLPIFIDTPLGRLDDEHRDNITKKYYPYLSEQVVLFSTNSEITPKRYKDIENNISKSYLLVNDGANTNLKTGYFQSYEN